MKKQPLKYRDGFWAAIFLAPNLLCFLAFTVYPILFAFILSFLEWDILSPPVFQGLSNYIALFTVDAVFKQVLLNTLIFTVVTVPIGLLLSMFIAVLLNTGIHGQRIYRALFFLPVLSSSVMVAILWKWLYNPSFGVINYFLKLLGFAGPNWLTDVKWALPAVMIVSIWKGLGSNMLIFLAGLQGIPAQYYEAVEIDGGGKFQQFKCVTLPMLMPTTFFVMIMSTIGSFQVFDVVMMMTGGGPGRTTSVLVHYLYQNAFQFFKMGYASAISYVLFVIVLLLTILQFRFNRTDDWALT